jgi:hypothetical protein
MPDTATKREQKPRDVEYTLEIVDDLPDLDTNRRKPLTDQIEKIVATPESHGKFVRMASYANASAASAAANGLRQKYGDKEAVLGWKFVPRRVDDITVQKNGQDVTEARTVLFVRYTPEAVVEGEHEAFKARLEERKAKNAQRRAEKKAAEANGESTSTSKKASPRR